MPAWLQRSGLLQAPYLSPWRLRLVRLRQTAAPSLKSGSDEAFWDFGGTGEQRLPVEPSGGQGIDEQVERLGWSGVAGVAGVGGQHHAVVANSGDEGSQARGVAVRLGEQLAGGDFGVAPLAVSSLAWPMFMAGTV